MTLSLKTLRPESGQKESVKQNDFPDWTGATVVIVATGPSLNAFQLEHLKKHKNNVKTIAVNEAGLSRYSPLSVPDADILYAADSRWWEYYKPAFSGYRFSGEEVENVDTVPLKMLERNEPLSRSPGSVVSGGHSGFQAIGLALSLGAARILLLGFDAGKYKGQRNAHTDRPEHFNRDAPFDQWAETYSRVPKEFPDVEVINCSPFTNITAFPIADIKDVLCE